MALNLTLCYFSCHFHSFFLLQSLSQPSTMEGSLGGRKTQLFTDVGLYRGNLVAIQWVHRKHVDLTRAVKLELKQVQCRYSMHALYAWAARA